MIFWSRWPPTCGGRAKYPRADRRRPQQRWNERADPPAGCDKLPIAHSKCKRRPAMKKNNTTAQSPKRAAARQAGPNTIGMDLGDKTSRYCMLGAGGETVSEGSVGTPKKAMNEKFGGMGRCRVAIEVGTHSPWASRLPS